MSSETMTRNDLKAIFDEIGIVAYEKNTGYGDGVSITSYTSASNPYTCPSDGIIIIGGTYRSGHYIMLYDVKGTVVAETASGGSANDAGNTVIPTPVFEGQKFYVIQTSGNYCTAYFIPFTKVYNLKEPAVAVDYIVEQGTDNGWKYRKWNNGDYDAWRDYNSTGMSLTSSSAGTYYNGTVGNGIKNITLPSFNVGLNFYATANPTPSISSGVYIYSLGRLDETTLQVGYRAHASTSSGVCNGTFHVHGRWK